MEVIELEIPFRITIRPGEKLIILDSKNEGSALLSALAGHIKKSSGRIGFHGKMAYVSSKLWFSRDSIRDNIILKNLYQSKKLDEVIYNADLHEEVKLYEYKDKTLIRNGVFSLSQLNRIAYARGLYTEPDVVLLDNTFKTMNRMTIEALMRRIDKKLKNKTFIIATDSMYCLSEKDHVLIFVDGKAVEYGQYR